MQHSTLGQRGMHHRSFHAFPVLSEALTHDDYVEWHSKWAKRSAQTHHLGVTIGRIALYDQEVEVAVESGVAARASRTARS